MSRANLLVIEDDPLQRHLIKENLRKEGFNVFEAERAREALPRARVLRKALRVFFMG